MNMLYSPLTLTFNYWLLEKLGSENTMWTAAARLTPGASKASISCRYWSNGSGVSSGDGSITKLLTGFEHVIGGGVSTRIISSILDLLNGVELERTNTTQAC